MKLEACGYNAIEGIKSVVVLMEAELEGLQLGFPEFVK